MSTMILIGLGANLPSTAFGPPRETLTAALAALARRGVTVVRRSRWYETRPVPASDQPMYVNAVAEVATRLAPRDLLVLLHEIEASLGRTRRVRNEARVVDLDLLDYDGMVADGSGGGPILPHPRLHKRAFVLVPLAEIAPHWVHPASGRTASELVAALPPGEPCRPIG
jgi:2-amino-4-hydroxy-6-hydroxymethyldihydropteridine diphosphokinase